MDLFKACRNVRGFQHFAPYATTLAEMWGKYDHSAWERDLEIAQRAGANTLRFWLSSDAFEKNATGFLNAFEDALKIADSKGMKCIVGLFNAWTSICPGKWSVGHVTVADAALPATRKYEPYVRAVIEAHKNDDRILLWETCNEPEFLGNDGVMQGFIEYWYAFIKGVGPVQPVSVALFKYWQVDQLAHCTDVINFHRYDIDADVLESNVEYLKNIGRRLGKPVLCTETGTGSITEPYPEECADWLARHHSEITTFGGEEQHKENVRMQMEMMEKHQIGYVLPWLVGGIAADTCDEKQSDLGNLALFRTDGSPRAAGSIIKWNVRLED